MGLSPDVLHRLLTTDDDSSGTSTPLEIASNAAAGPSTAPAPQPISQRQIATEPSHVHAQQDGDDEVLEFEFESDEASPPTFGTSSTPGAGPSHGARPGVNGGSRHNIVKLASGVRRGYVRDPLLDDADVGNEGDHEGARGDTDSFGTSYSSNGGGESHPSSLHESGHNRRHSSFSRTRNFRVRLLSDTNPSSPDQTLNAGSSRGSRTQRSADNGKDEIAPHARARTEPTPIRPFGVADMLRTQYGDQEDLTPPLGASNGFQRPGSADGQCVGKSSAFGVGEHSHRRTVRRSMNQGGVRAQYVFAGKSHRSSCCAKDRTSAGVEFYSLVRRYGGHGQSLANLSNGRDRCGQEVDHWVLIHTGDSSHPEPQLRFHLPPRPSPSSSSSRSTSPNPSGPSDSASTDDDAAGSGSGFGSHGASGEGEGEEDMEDLTTLPIPAPVPLRSHGHTRRHGGSGSLTSSPATIKAGYKSPFLVPAIGISSPSMLPGSASKGKGTQMPIPQSPTLQRLNMVRSPIFALATGSGTGSGSPGLRTQGQGKKGSGPESGSPKMDGEGLRDFDLGEAAVDGLDEVEGDRYQISLDDGTKGSNGAVGEVEGCTETCPAHPASTSPDRRPLSVLPSVGAADAGSASPSSTAIATVAAPAEMAPAAVPQTLITPPAPRHNHTHSHSNGHANGRDIIVPLSSDRAFFDLLTAALTSLSVFHAAQQVAFRDAVEKLCRMISNSIVPQGSSVQIMPIPPVPSSSSPSPSAHSGLVTTHGIQRPPQELLSRRINKLHKKDLYAWREIFTLWIEAEIFESSAERTRGERTVEEAEKRLQAFAHEVVKRGLGDRRTFRGKKTREAWEEFLRLNVLLLDLKRFQLANINAARK